MHPQLCFEFRVGFLAWFLNQSDFAVKLTPSEYKFLQREVESTLIDVLVFNNTGPYGGSKGVKTVLSLASKFDLDIEGIAGHEVAGEILI